MVVDLVIPWLLMAGCREGCGRCGCLHFRFHQISILVGVRMSEQCATALFVGRRGAIFFHSRILQIFTEVNPGQVLWGLWNWDQSKQKGNFFYCGLWLLIRDLIVIRNRKMAGLGKNWNAIKKLNVFWMAWTKGMIEKNFFLLIRDCGFRILSALRLVIWGCSI